MRLTNLFKDQNVQIKTVRKHPSKNRKLLSNTKLPQSLSKKSKYQTIHLHSEDIGELYDIGSSSDIHDASSLTEREKRQRKKACSRPKKAFSQYDIEKGQRDELLATSEKSFTTDRENSFMEKPLQTDFIMDSGGHTSGNVPEFDAEVPETTGRYDRNVHLSPEPVNTLESQPEESNMTDDVHSELLSILDDIYTEGKEGKRISVERLINPIINLIQVCKTSNIILRKAIQLKKIGETFTTHNMNVSILAVKIGIFRGFSDGKLFSIALCALLSDIGMMRVDTSILNKTSKLTPEEFQKIKRHIDYSVEIISTISNEFPFLVPIIYQVHERENGSGYPRGLRGENIHEFAKIIGMSDVYIALTEPKVSREKYSGYIALQQIISRRGIDFDAKIIKSLIDLISVFPLESLVKLNNGEIGRVIDISSIHPTRPKLSILINSDGEKLLKPRFLDLEKEPLLYIENPDIEEGIVL